ncbi:MAG: RNA polymerase sigma factor [Candidatus Aminicenantes bacterium]|nr:RNA polymerase sigma factor [Candidatus Aminicenantes bacterium]
MDREGIPKKVSLGAVVTEKRPVDTDRLVEDHKNLVYHLIHRTVRDRTAHEEIFQEVFLNVLESLPRFEGRSKLSTWIASIAVHTCYKFIQKAGKRERVESFGDWLEGGPEPDVPSDLQENLERSDVRRRLERHLGELGPKYALPVTLFYLEGMSYQEIAEILEVPLGTVKSHLFRGLKELRKRIEGGEDGHLLG